MAVRIADETDRATRQLETFERVSTQLDALSIPHWVFGGWAVDFHASVITRPHEDIDIAIFAEDFERVATVLRADGWTHAPDEGEDGYTGYERDDLRLEVALLARAEDGRIYTPLRNGEADWPHGAFGSEVRTLGGIRACVIGLDALRAEKSEARADPHVAAKDAKDLVTLDRAKEGRRERLA